MPYRFLRTYLQEHVTLSCIEHYGSNRKLPCIGISIQPPTHHFPRAHHGQICWFQTGFCFFFFLYIFFNQFGAIGLRYDFDAPYRNVQVLFSPISVSYIGQDASLDDVSCRGYWKTEGMKYSASSSFYNVCRFSHQIVFLIAIAVVKEGRACCCVCRGLLTCISKTTRR